MDRRVLHSVGIVGGVSFFQKLRQRVDAMDDFTKVAIGCALAALVIYGFVMYQMDLKIDDFRGLGILPNPR